MKSTWAEHNRFVAAASTHKYEDAQQHNSTWHDCIKSPEPEWYDCQERVWAHTKQQLIPKHPGHTTSEIRRMQGDRKVEAVTAQYQKSMAAVEEAGDDQAEEEGRQRGRRIGCTQREDTKEPADTKQESDARVNNRVSAGVAHARREAKTRRDKPCNDIKKLIQEARQPNRKSNATAACMLTRMIESNKVIIQMQQTHQQWRANITRQRKARLAK